MEKLRCKTCGCVSLIPMDVAVEGENHSLFDRDQESRFFTCHVCGDNWLSVKEKTDEGDQQITFIHQMGMEPVLKRVAHLQAPMLAKEQLIDYWDYYVDDEQIAEEVWREKLESRRSILKSICCN